MATKQLTLHLTPEQNARFEARLAYYTARSTPVPVRPSDIARIVFEAGLTSDEYTTIPAGEREAAAQFARAQHDAWDAERAAWQAEREALLAELQLRNPVAQPTPEIEVVLG